ATESDLVIRTLRAAFGSHAPSTAPDWALRPGITLFVFLGFEFGYYVDHYLKHKISFLWEFHKPHHTAEVLTPLTVFRVHPIDTLIFLNIVAVFTGLFHGVFIYAAGKDVNIYVIDGTNIITVAFLFLSAQRASCKIIWNASHNPFQIEAMYLESIRRFSRQYSKIFRFTVRNYFSIVSILSS